MMGPSCLLVVEVLARDRHRVVIALHSHSILAIDMYVDSGLCLLTFPRLCAYFANHSINNYIIAILFWQMDWSVLCSVELRLIRYSQVNIRKYNLFCEIAPNEKSCDN